MAVPSPPVECAKQSASFDYVGEENRSAAGLDREKMETMTQADAAGVPDDPGP